MLFLNLSVARLNFFSLHVIVPPVDWAGGHVSFPPSAPFPLPIALCSLLVGNDGGLDVDFGLDWARWRSGTSRSVSNVGWDKRQEV